MTGKVQRIERQQSRGFLKNAILLIPNFLKLLFRLFRDPRVPLAEKALLVGAIVYVISPLDLIPDFIPFIGEVDDLYFVALTLLRLFARTPDAVIREHWDGGGDIAGVANKIVRAAQYILPKRIRRIILGRVEIGSKLKGGLISSPEIPDPIEMDEKRARRKR
ncbi:MAG TPA: YkvA family protein [Blastocatellia bacterium]|nr:YkvA family protein [Blastocatellia bacterium]